MLYRLYTDRQYVFSLLFVVIVCFLLVLVGGIISWEWVRIISIEIVTRLGILDDHNISYQ